MNRPRKRDAVIELPLRQIFDEVCRTVDAGGNDVAFAAIESQVCLPIHARLTQRSRASISVAGTVNTGDGDTASSLR